MTGAVASAEDNCWLRWTGYFLKGQRILWVAALFHSGPVLALFKHAGIFYIPAVAVLRVCSLRKDGLNVENLTEEKVCHLAMSPLYVLYLVASEYLAPEKITQRHIVRAMEYGLVGHTSFSEAIFELLRSNLHEFYAELSDGCAAGVQRDLRGELLSVKQTLSQLTGPPEMIDDFRTALKKLAVFVAGGGAFRKEIDDPGMQAQAEWIAELLH